MDTTTLTNRINALLPVESFDRAFSVAELQSLGCVRLRRIYAAARDMVCQELDTDYPVSEFNEDCARPGVLQGIAKHNHPAAMTRAALAQVELYTTKRSRQISPETLEWGGFLGGTIINSHPRAAVLACIAAGA